MGIYVTKRYSHGFGQKPGRRIKKRLIFALGLVATALFAVGAKLIRSDKVSAAFSSAIFEVGPGDVLETPITLFDNFFATRVQIYDQIQSGENLFSALRRLQVPAALAERFSSAIGKSANLKLLLPGDVLMIESASPSVQLAGINDVPALASSLKPRAVELFVKNETGVAYRIRAAQGSEDVSATIDVTADKPKVYKEHALLNGVVTNSLYGAIVNNGGDAQLVDSFSGIFGWQFDFYRDTRDGDTYQMIVERNVSEGRFVGYGRVLAAEYTNGGKLLRGFYFESSDGTVSGFFDDKGRSLKNAFLKSPLKLASIGSRFGMRFHPILKRMKPHNGVDYGANRGTPFMAVASGTVIDAGFSRFNGNWVRVRHMNGYETEYLHATKLGKGIRVGARVEQGQVIGFVGKTGLATGYHLHFGMKHMGKYVNPAGQKFARSDGVPSRYMTEFNKNIQAMVIAFNRQAPDRQQVVAFHGQEQANE